MKRKQISQLIAILKIVQAMLSEAIGEAAAAAKPKKRTRRTGAELARFHVDVVSARKAGIPVSELAREYGVTESHIYKLVSTKPRQPSGKKRKLRLS